jgi:LysR family hydrogen peroxide-inducible transcriptional activator
MNFQQLKYALAVDQHKHFGNASIHCEVTQATLSGMLKRLEDELGYELFDRSHHPILTTEKGKEFMSSAAKMLELQEGLFQINDNDGELKGEIRLGIIPTIANTLLPLMLSELIDRHPDLKLNLSEVTTEEIIEQLNANELDIGILSTPLADEMTLEGKEVLYYEAMHVYGLTSHQGDKISLQELKDHRIWLLEEGHCFRNQSMAICGLSDKKAQQSQLNFKSNSFDTLLNLSDQFGGFTLLPELYYRQLPKKRKAKCKSFKNPIPAREVSLVSARPRVNQNRINVISRLIREIVPPKLSTYDLKSSEMDVIAM